MNGLVVAAAAAAAEGETPLAWWQDPAIWVSVAFLVVVALLVRMGAFKSMGQALDKRSQKIADDPTAAEPPRAAAEPLLAQYQKRQREAEVEAKVIIEEARREASRLGDEMRRKIAEQIDRRAKAAEDKIGRAEAQALAEVRGQAADLAVEAARHIIRARVDQGAQTALVDKAISDLRQRAN
ncbi:MAG: F0F1 ATP synthase subunit B [Parvularculaceae bacterium]|nr:F0F1 ATP synthase subunit B [Parvularculaceae bacterium]